MAMKGCFSILSNLNNTVVWIVSTRTLISKSSPPLVNIPRAPITTGIIVTFMFHNFFQFPSKVQALILLFAFFQFYCGPPGQQSPQFCKFSLFFVLFFIIIKCGRLAKIMWSICIQKSQRSLCISFSSTDSGLCIYHLFVWSNLNFLHISQWITLPIQLCLVLFTFSANLLHSLIMWLIVSSLSPHNQHLVFWCVLSILALIWLVLMALFCAAIKSDSVSLLRFPFLSYVHVFSFERLLVNRKKIRP